jgi:leucyl-tRNA synthetase
VPEQDLPVKLPEDVDFLPTGESPLKFSKTFHEIICPQCGGNECRREVDTMDTFVCSSWYFFRYADPQNNEVFANKEIIKYWLPVDTYVGGAEHTVMHLLYARFFTKALHRHQYIDFDEPFKKLRHQGIILGEDNEKMSKSRGNVINPDDIITEYGADTLRMYEMFMGEFAQTKPWNMKGIMGCHKFLQRVWRLYESKPIVDEKPNANLIRLIHKSIKKVSRDIESFRFNTAISQTMIFTNTLYKEEKLNQFAFSTLLILLSPVAPHLAEELWNKLGHPESIIKESWPKYDESLAQDEMIELVIQINGKVRDKLEVPTDIVKEDALKQAKGSERIQKYLAEGELVKEIFVPGKLINLVVR